ncbi:hypothetical protein ROZALSC1DRAFT_20986 [Rozella allomycis CSF55]|uniref:Uncharacterized protein n=1 Tax=Rozella allomycis (strain CSF55) TaxID=988480 RepID=A0A4V1J0A7_ROZAC|nr:hypothetical protein ROZALSC1DRAFT_20986 [Rozella allomycis CSF55]
MEMNESYVKEILSKATRVPLDLSILEYEQISPTDPADLWREKIEPQFIVNLSLVDALLDYKECTKSWCDSSFISCAKVWNVEKIDDLVVVHILAIFSRPSHTSPIPKSTAKVWFCFLKVGHIVDIYFRSMIKGHWFTGLNHREHFSFAERTKLLAGKSHINKRLLNK